HYQHLSYADQLRFKQEIVKDQLKRIGKFTEPPVEPILASPNEWNYRNTVQFHLSPKGKPGYKQANSNQIVEISECHLPMPAINATWPQLGIEPSSGVDRITLREGIDGDLMLGLEGNSDSAPEFEVDFPVSAVYLGNQSEILLSGEPYTWMRVKERDFMVSAGSFFQVNLPQAEKMVELVLKFLDPKPADTILDGYCGVGLFSAFIAPKVKKVIGIELSESACSDYAQNMDEFDNVELYVGLAEQILPSLKANPNKVVVDPPRAGLDKSVLDAILKITPELIAYVSCDPSTLARDARRFVENGYELTSVIPIDLFPQTYHIECIALFSSCAKG
ncbi:class I SAM-dependent RNA methyltransferase, partial [bacterium]|nr:class I SAM-dependent RNA methyltransferase [bacterium]